MGQIVKLQQAALVQNEKVITLIYHLPSTDGGFNGQVIAYEYTFALKSLKTQNRVHYRKWWQAVNHRRLISIVHLHNISFA